MNTKLLEDALILLEQKNLTAAAELRNMTQPAFSRRIQALERWVGHPLLTREANRISVSQNLIESAPQIRALLAQLAQLQQQLNQPEAASHALVLTAPHTLSASAVAELLEHAHAGEAPWHIRLVTRNQDEAVSHFLSREADLLLSYENRKVQQMPFDDSVVRNVWRPDAFLPVVGGDLRHLIRADGRLPDKAPKIAYPQDSMFGKIIAEHEAGTSIRLPARATVESTFSVGVANLVKAGMGAAWVPKCLIQSEIRNGDITVLTQDYGRIPMDIALYFHESDANSARFLKPVLSSNAIT